MKVETTFLENVLLITPEVFEDHRGEYVETWNEKEYKRSALNLTGDPVDFVCDDISTSFKGVLRGLHGDNKTWKLVQCLYGRLYLVVLNKNGEWGSFTLSARNRQQVLIPPGYANGHQALTDHIIFSYKQSEYYDPESQFTIPYNSIDIYWPLKPILSERDRCKK